MITSSPRLPCREMERVAALVHNVSATFGRRDFLRRNMDKIEAMIADSGALLVSVPCLLISNVQHVVLMGQTHQTRHQPRL